MKDRVLGKIKIKWVLYVVAILIALSLHLLQNDYAGFIDLLISLMLPPIHIVHLSPFKNKKGEG